MKLKKLLSIILSVLLLTAVIPLGMFTASAATYSGSCGTNVTWEYDNSTYTLTISGTGAMSDYNSSSYNSTKVTTAPWRSYYQAMKTVVIGSGVTSIGDRAFYGCTGLASITIPDSVTSIGNSVFSDCTGLTSITIPDSVTSIGGYVFYYCTGLTSITIPNSVTSIGGYVFYYCTGLKSVTIGNSVTSIGKAAFSGCKKIKSVTIGNSVTSIDEGAFNNCTGLTSIIIPNSVTSIGDSAFYGCTGLKSVTIPDSVTEIGGYAFGGCIGLTSITIPDSVTSVGRSAFNGCTGLTAITIPDSVTEIGGYAFGGCTGLTSITIPDSVTSMGSGAFGGCTGLTSITIPDSIISIGDSVFENCAGLTSVTIGNSVTSIGYRAFNNCTGLTSITIPDSVTSIYREAFSGCTGLTSITIPDSVTSIGDGAFYSCTGLTLVTIGDSVTSIGEYAFYGCTGLTSITIPDSVITIGNEAFNCCQIKNLIISKGSKTVTSTMVVCKSTLESITIPNSVTSIGDSAFYGCTGLKSVTIPDSVTSIGYSAFNNCTGLTSITIPDSVTSVGRSAFGGCTGLTSITIPDSVTSISNQAFEGCIGLTSITIPDSVTSIGGSAFGGCTGLTSITIPDSVTSIGRGAFGSTKLKDVFYKGTTQQKAKISIGDNNSPLTNATWHCIVNLNYKPATCTEAGYTGDMGWEGYDVVFSYGEEIPALGHDYIAKATEPTCTAQGYTTHTCSRCKDSYIDSYTNELGHDYNPVITEPTCTAQGYTTHTCSRCGDSYKDNYTYMPCGENAGFIIENNTLYIHGSGETDSYKTQTFVPWYDYADQIKEVIIDKGITKIGTYAFYCLDNLESVICKNENTEFGRYALNDSNGDITVFAENGGNLETYCEQNGVSYIDTTITPELEAVTANSIIVKAVVGYEYSLGGTVWQKSNIFTGLSPAREYNIYARYIDTADMFEVLGEPLNMTTLKSTVVAPAAPDYQGHTDNSITVIGNPAYEYSIDGENWQTSATFENLNKNLIYRIYARVAETETEYASEPSAPLIIAIPDKPEILEAGYESILVKYVEGFEYCLDDFVWQDSNTFDKLIDNTEYYVYQRLKSVDGEKVYQITSDYTTVTTDNSIAHTHTFGEWVKDIEKHWHVCGACGEKLDEASHTESDWITDSEALPGVAGLRHKECTVCGYITETEEIPALAAYEPGDINGDSAVDNKDLTRLFQYLSNWEVEVNEVVLDVNGDNSVDNKDLTRLFQYLSNWDVEIY